VPRVTRRPLAETDILEIWDYIADDSLAAADRWVDRLDEQFRVLATQPMRPRPLRVDRWQRQEHRIGRGGNNGGKWPYAATRSLGLARLSGQYSIPPLPPTIQAFID
jgi:plasmid stabilization system protein ParE